MSVSKGLHADFPETDYHRHPALSYSSAKRLLPPSCPAIFKWERDNGRVEKREWDFGHAAHAKVLGVGAEIVVVQKTAKDGTKSDADNYNTKSAQEHRDAIRDEGKVPILAAEVAVIDAMADAIRAHPIASVLFDPDHGKPEQSMFWHDERFGVDRRCRLDWLPDPRDGRLILPDYKTAVTANPDAFARSAYDFGYHQQDDFYREGARALGLDDDPAFVFVVQMKTAPYLVSVVELDDTYRKLGRRRNEQALEVFAECTATGVWPGWADNDIPLLSPPAWAARELESAA